MNTLHEQLSDFTPVPLPNPCAAVYGCMQMIRHAYQLRDATPEDVGPPAQALHPLACGDHNYPLFKHFPPSAVKLQVSCSLQLRHSLQCCMSASRIGLCSKPAFLTCLSHQPTGSATGHTLACLLAYFVAGHALMPHHIVLCRLHDCLPFLQAVSCMNVCM